MVATPRAVAELITAEVHPLVQEEMTELLQQAPERRAREVAARVHSPVHLERVLRPVVRKLALQPGVCRGEIIVPWRLKFRDDSDPAFPGKLHELFDLCVRVLPAVVDRGFFKERHALGLEREGLLVVMVPVEDTAIAKP